MNKLSGKTAKENILKEVEKTLIRDKLKWNLLRCVAIDGSKKTCLKPKTCLVKQIYKACKNVKCLKINGYLWYYSSASTLQNTFGLVMLLNQ